MLPFTSLVFLLPRRSNMNTKHSTSRPWYLKISGWYIQLNKTKNSSEAHGTTKKQDEAHEPECWHVCWRLRTLADGRGRLRAQTQHLANTALPSDPQSETGTLAMHSGEKICWFISQSSRLACWSRTGSAILLKPQKGRFNTKVETMWPSERRVWQKCEPWSFMQIHMPFAKQTRNAFMSRMTLQNFISHLRRNPPDPCLLSPEPRNPPEPHHSSAICPAEPCTTSSALSQTRLYIMNPALQPNSTTPITSSPFILPAIAMLCFFCSFNVVFELFCLYLSFSGLIGKRCSVVAPVNRNNKFSEKLAETKFGSFQGCRVQGSRARGFQGPGLQGPELQ